MFRKLVRNFVEVVKAFQRAGFVAPRRIIPIDKFIVHAKPHLDEILGAFLIAIFGEKFFPGARKALESGSLEFREPVETEEQCFKRRALAIGCGEGFLFNEHRTKKKRVENQSASTRIAEYIEMLDDPSLRRLLIEALICDTNPGCRTTMLAELVKIDNRQKFGDGRIAFKWAKPALEAIIAREFQLNHGIDVPKQRGERTLVEHFEAWAKKGKLQAKNPRACEAMREQFADSERLKDEIVTEAAHIVEAMHRVGKARKEVAEWLEYVFVSKYIEQCDFQDELSRQDGNDPIIIDDAILDGERRTILLSLVQSDSQVAHKVARFRRNAMQKNIPYGRRFNGITAVRNFKGNYFIVVDEEIKDCRVGEPDSEGYGILDYPSRMISILELSVMGEKELPWKFWSDLGNPGDSWDGFWHYFVEGGMLMNGSPTHPKPPSGLTLKDIEVIFTYGLNPEKMRAWCRMFP